MNYTYCVKYTICFFVSVSILKPVRDRQIIGPGLNSHNIENRFKVSVSLCRYKPARVAAIGKAAGRLQIHHTQLLKKKR